MSNKSKLHRVKKPAPEFKSRYLKLDLLRLAILKKYGTKEQFQIGLQKTITINRSVINS